MTLPAEGVSRSELTLLKHEMPPLEGRATDRIVGRWDGVMGTLQATGRYGVASAGA